MFEYRVTKYDPYNRDLNGRYTGEEWTSWLQIGREFGAEVLTIQDYWRVEDNYVVVAVQMLSESGIHELTVCALENARGYAPETFDLHEGAVLSGNALQH